MGHPDGLYFLDILGHAVVAQLVAQQGQAFVYEGAGRMQEPKKEQTPESDQCEGLSGFCRSE